MPGTLTLRPILAKIGDPLKPVDSHVTKLDPYCVAIIGNEHAQSDVCKQGGDTPYWGDSLLVRRVTDEPFCFIEVKDKHILKDKILGVTAIDIEDLTTSGSSKKWYELYQNKEPVGEILVEATYNKNVYEGYSNASVAEKGYFNLEETMDGKEIQRNIPEALLTGRSTTRPYSLSVDATHYSSTFTKSPAKSFAQSYYSPSQVKSSYPPNYQPVSSVQQEVNELTQKVDQLLARSRQTEKLVASRSITSGQEEGIPEIPHSETIDASHRKFSDDMPYVVSRRDTARMFSSDLFSGDHHLMRRNEAAGRRGPLVGERYAFSERKHTRDRVTEFGLKVQEKFEHLKESTRETYYNLKDRLSHTGEAEHEGKMSLMKDKMVGKLAHLGKERREIQIQTDESYRPYEVVIRRDMMRETHGEGAVDKVKAKVGHGVDKIKEAGHRVKESLETCGAMGKPVDYGEVDFYDKERKRDAAKRKMNEGMEKLREMTVGILRKLDLKDDDEELVGLEGEKRELKRRELLKSRFGEGLDYLNALVEDTRGEMSDLKKMHDRTERVGHEYDLQRELRMQQYENPAVQTYVYEVPRQGMVYETAEPVVYERVWDSGLIQHNEIKENVKGYEGYYYEAPQQAVFYDSAEPVLYERTYDSGLVRNNEVKENVKRVHDELNVGWKDIKGNIKENVRQGVEYVKGKVNPSKKCYGLGGEEGLAEKIQEGLPMRFTLEDQHLDKGEAIMEKMPGNVWSEVERMQEGRKIGEAGVASEQYTFI